MSKESKPLIWMANPRFFKWKLHFSNFKNTLNEIVQICMVFCKKIKYTCCVKNVIQVLKCVKL